MPNSYIIDLFKKRIIKLNFDVWLVINYDLLKLRNYEINANNIEESYSLVYEFSIFNLVMIEPNVSIKISNNLISKSSKLIYDWRDNLRRLEGKEVNVNVKGIY